MGGFGSGQVYEWVGRYSKKLIGAVVECVTNNAPPPAELKIAWQCERWHTLPDVGGLHDQDYTLMRRMNTCMNIYNAVQRIYSLQGKQIHTLSDSERAILKSLMDLGLLFHG